MYSKILCFQIWWIFMFRLVAVTILLLPTRHFQFGRFSAEVLIGMVSICTDKAIHGLFGRSSVAIPVRTEWIMSRGFSWVILVVWQRFCEPLPDLGIPSMCVCLCVYMYLVWNRTQHLLIPINLVLFHIV